MCELDSEECRSIRRNGSGNGRAETREEGLEATPSVQLSDHTSDRHVALGCLESALDCVDREDGDPHRHAGGGTCAGDSGQTQFSVGLSSDRVLGRQLSLDVLVRGEVGGGSRAITGQGGRGATEDGSDTAFLVELPYDIQAAAVLGFLAGRELLLALDLQHDLDALKGGGDGGHRNGGEETGCRDLGDREGAIRTGLRNAAHEVLAHVVTPEGDRD